MAASLNYYKEQLVKILYQDSDNKYLSYLVQVEKKTQVKREYIALGE